ncbi:DUF5996 family protein [Phycisphaerales bacterium AB-hyl4]|uniref:DUF5996 family protein n=1 Tax=Natronomicrosphaera hydrolytica TaxID=3242702 RepID=A0ABV4U805_9BACT
MSDSIRDSDTFAEDWPALPLEAWSDTYTTLHLWTQIVGKIRLAQAPMVNHWWQVPLYVTTRGLTTSPMPHGRRLFQIDFDFLDHLLRIQTDDGQSRELALRSCTVADFYHEIMAALHKLGLTVKVWPRPVEIEDPIIPCDQDHQHRSYEPEQAQRFWRVLVQVDRVLQQFRSRFIGKCSPVHFFWGSFDMAVTRFSGHRAPPHPGGVPNLADWVVREAYSHECSSCGFWPGNGAIKAPAFYAYTYPEPEGFKDYPVQPKQAFYHPQMREFVLLYDDVRQAEQPEAMLLNFLQSTYEAAAEAAGWDRQALEVERPAPGPPPDPKRAPTFPQHKTDDPQPER